MNSPKKMVLSQEETEEVPAQSSPSFGSLLEDAMLWWPDLPDVDRLNILSAPLEERARILAAKYSFSLDVAVRKIAEKAELPFVETFELVENPTKRLPLRLIHAFGCLPIKRVEKKLPSKLKVLCVDDDESILQAFRRTLGRDYEICTAANGMDGLEVFKEHGDIAIVLSDMVMPEMNGPEMLELIKQYEPKTMTVLLTGHSDFELTKNAVNSGKVFKILTKPCSSSEILATLSECADKYIQMLDFRTSAEIDDGKIHLATVWPPSPRMSRWIFAVSGLKPIWHMGMPEKIIRAITENFGIGADSLEDSDLDEEGEAEVQDDLEDQNAAIIKFVNEVIQRAIVDRATDIHFEPHKETLQIRYRIDGQLVPVRVPDNLRSFQDAIISRIKIMGGINISEKRRPQGGRITFTHGQSDLDIRVSTLPTLYGESISLRLLNEKSQPLSMRELGLLGKDEANIVKVLEKPHGIVMVTGPTGSGKSTSLTAFIRRIHKPERRIMTVEDPVEYEVAGINQTQVNSEIGFTFASALREILRQDPDVIMVGEIRDRETADIAIRASLTGHLVLSTLHTNDAPGALTRLIDMEIEPFLIASSVEMIIAQRLVRRLCQHCARPTTLAESMIKSHLITLGLPQEEYENVHLIREPDGCDRCGGRGYRGRVGIFEVLVVSDEMHGPIVEKASSHEIRELALHQGMRSLPHSGWEQVKRGLIHLPDIMRYADIGSDDETL